jgi:hypothetical protein
MKAQIDHKRDIRRRTCVPHMRRTYIALAIFACAEALAACTDATPSISFEQTLDLDVVLHRDRVVVFTNASDVPCECEATAVRFPSPESCVYLDDVRLPCTCRGTAGSSCITSVRVVGTEKTIDITGSRGNPFEGDISGIGRPTLFIAGCAPTEIEMPLDWSVVETPTLTARYRAHHVEAAWAATAPLALVEGGWALGADRCVTAAASLRFPTPTPPSPPPYVWTNLSTLQLPETISTDGATARIWSASDRVSLFGPPCRDDDTLCWVGTDDQSVH